MFVRIQCRTFVAAYPIPIWEATVLVRDLRLDHPEVAQGLLHFGLKVAMVLVAADQRSPLGMAASTLELLMCRQPESTPFLRESAPRPLARAQHDSAATPRAHVR